MQSPRHYFPAVVRNHRQASSAVTEECAGTPGRQQERHHGPRDTLVIGILDPYYGFLGVRQSDVVDRSIAL
jgi:hypothetical protein